MCYWSFHDRQHYCRFYSLVVYFCARGDAGKRNVRCRLLDSARTYLCKVVTEGQSVCHYLRCTWYIDVEGNIIFFVTQITQVIRKNETGYVVLITEYIRVRRATIDCH